MSNPDFRTALQAKLEEIQREKTEGVQRASAARAGDRERFSPFTEAVQRFLNETREASEEFRLLFPGTPHLYTADQSSWLLNNPTHPYIRHVSDTAPVLLSSDPTKTAEGPFAFLISIEAHPSSVHPGIMARISFLNVDYVPYRDNPNYPPLSNEAHNAVGAASPQELKNTLQNVFVDFIAQQQHVVEQERAPQVPATAQNEESESILSRIAGKMGFGR